MKTSLPLAEGWRHCLDAEASNLKAEYARELPDIHPLAGLAVEVLACRDGNDDILLRHVEDESRYSTVHLTWLMRRESPNHPTLEFTGTYPEFVARELGSHGKETLAM
jgi:hypothetical protein